MTVSPIRFSDLVSLLRRRADDPGVVRFIERQPSEIERASYYGFVNFEERGLSVVFQEASQVLPPEQVTDPAQLYLAAFHLYREAYEGFAQYSANCPLV